VAEGEYESPPAPPQPTPPLPPPPHPPRSPRARRRLFVFLGAVSLVFFLFIALLLVLASSFQEGDDVGFAFTGQKVALVEIKGVILDSREIADLIRRYARDSSVSAIVLRINSPGGDVAASQEIFTEVKRIRDSRQKPIVASISSVGASGAYYIACPADRILANAGSVTGSIGVIASWMNYGDLYRWAKLKDVTIKSGEFKDTGSPTRDLSEEERQYYQGLVDEMHEQFVGHVAEARRLPLEKVRQIANGKVFSGAQAKRLGLVDDIGTYQDAIAAAAKLAGISGDPKVVEPAKERITLFDLLFGNIARYIPLPQGTSPVFEYRWAGPAAAVLEK